MSIDASSATASIRSSLQVNMAKIRATQENSPFYVDDDVLSSISSTRTTVSVPLSPLAEAIKARKHTEQKVQVLKNRVAYLAAEERRANRALEHTLAETQSVLAKKAERSKDEDVARVAAAELALLENSLGSKRIPSGSRVSRPQSGRSTLGANSRRVSMAGTSSSEGSTGRSVTCGRRLLPSPSRSCHPAFGVLWANRKKGSTNGELKENCCTILSEKSSSCRQGQRGEQCDGLPPRLRSQTVRAAEAQKVESLGGRGFAVSIPFQIRSGAPARRQTHRNPAAGNQLIGHE